MKSVKITLLAGLIFCGFYALVAVQVQDVAWLPSDWGDGPVEVEQVKVKGKRKTKKKSHSKARKKKDSRDKSKELASGNRSTHPSVKPAHLKMLTKKTLRVAPKMDVAVPKSMSDNTGSGWKDKVIEAVGGLAGFSFIDTIMHWIFGARWINWKVAEQRRKESEQALKEWEEKVGKGWKAFENDPEVAGMSHQHFEEWFRVDKNFLEAVYQGSELPKVDVAKRRKLVWDLAGNVAGDYNAAVGKDVFSQSDVMIGYLKYLREQSAYKSDSSANVDQEFQTLTQSAESAQIRRVKSNLIHVSFLSAKVKELLKAGGVNEAQLNDLVSLLEKDIAAGGLGWNDIDVLKNVDGLLALRMRLGWDNDKDFVDYLATDFFNVDVQSLFEAKDFATLAQRAELWRSLGKPTKQQLQAFWEIKSREPLDQWGYDKFNSYVKAEIALGLDSGDPKNIFNVVNSSGGYDKVVRRARVWELAGQVAQTHGQDYGGITQGDVYKALVQTFEDGDFQAILSAEDKVATAISYVDRTELVVKKEKQLLKDAGRLTEEEIEDFLTTLKKSSDQGGLGWDDANVLKFLENNAHHILQASDAKYEALIWDTYAHENQGEFERLLQLREKLQKDYPPRDEGDPGWGYLAFADYLKKDFNSQGFESLWQAKNDVDLSYRAMIWKDLAGRDGTAFHSFLDVKHALRWDYTKFGHYALAEGAMKLAAGDPKNIHTVIAQADGPALVERRARVWELAGQMVASKKDQYPDIDRQDVFEVVVDNYSDADFQQILSSGTPADTLSAYVHRLGSFAQKRVKSLLRKAGLGDEEAADFMGALKGKRFTDKDMLAYLRADADAVAQWARGDLAENDILTRASIWFDPNIANKDSHLYNSLMAAETLLEVVPDLLWHINDMYDFLRVDPSRVAKMRAGNTIEARLWKKYAKRDEDELKKLYDFAKEMGWKEADLIGYLDMDPKVADKILSGDPEQIADAKKDGQIWKEIDLGDADADRRAYHELQKLKGTFDPSWDDDRLLEYLQADTGAATVAAGEYGLSRVTKRAQIWIGRDTPSAKTFETVIKVWEFVDENKVHFNQAMSLIDAQGAEGFVLWDVAKELRANENFSPFEHSVDNFEGALIMFRNLVDVAQGDTASLLQKSAGERVKLMQNLFDQRARDALAAGKFENPITQKDGVWTQDDINDLFEVFPQLYGSIISGQFEFSDGAYASQLVPLASSQRATAESWDVDTWIEFFKEEAGRQERGGTVRSVESHQEMLQRMKKWQGDGPVTTLFLLGKDKFYDLTLDQVLAFEMLAKGQANSTVGAMRNFIDAYRQTNESKLPDFTTMDTFFTEGLNYRHIEGWPESIHEPTGADVAGALKALRTEGTLPETVLSDGLIEGFEIRFGDRPLTDGDVGKVFDWMTSQPERVQFLLYADPDAAAAALLREKTKKGGEWADLVGEQLRNEISSALSKLYRDDIDKDQANNIAAAATAAQKRADGARTILELWTNMKRREITTFDFDPDSLADKFEEAARVAGMEVDAGFKAAAAQMQRDVKALMSGEQAGRVKEGFARSLKDGWDVLMDVSRDLAGRIPAEKAYMSEQAARAAEGAYLAEHLVPEEERGE